MMKTDLASNKDWLKKSDIAQLKKNFVIEVDDVAFILGMRNYYFTKH